MPLIRQIEDRWIAWTVVRVKILDASLSVRVRPRPYLASLYISKSTACKTSSATRGSREDRAPCARCTRLRPKQNGSHRSRFIVFSLLRCFLPRVLASRSSAAVDPIVRSIQNVSCVSLLCSTARPEHTRPNVVFVAFQSASRLLRDDRWLVAFWLPSVFSRDTLFYIEEERPSGT